MPAQRRSPHQGRVARGHPQGGHSKAQTASTPSPLLSRLSSGSHIRHLHAQSRRRSTVCGWWWLGMATSTHNASTSARTSARPARGREGDCSSRARRCTGSHAAGVRAPRPPCKSSRHPWALAGQARAQARAEVTSQHGGSQKLALAGAAADFSPARTAAAASRSSSHQHQ